MAAEISPARSALNYLLGLGIWIAATAVGNLAGRIIASLQGWDDFSYDRPGGVFYAGMQAGLGAYFSLLATVNWLGDGKYARLWLTIFVWLGSGLTVVIIGLALVSNRTNMIGWKTLATVVSLVVTEFVRRVPDGDLG